MLIAGTRMLLSCSLVMVIACGTYGIFSKDIREGSFGSVLYYIVFLMTILGAFAGLALVVANTGADIDDE